MQYGAAGHGFDGNHSEIFLAGKHERAASRIVVSKYIKGLRAHHRQRSVRRDPNLIQHLAAADHDKLEFQLVNGVSR